MNKHVISRVQFGRKWGHPYKRLHQDQLLTARDVSSLVAFVYPGLVHVGSKWVDLDTGTAFEESQT